MRLIIRYLFGLIVFLNFLAGQVLAGKRFEVQILQNQPPLKIDGANVVLSSLKHVLEQLGLLNSSGDAA